MSDSVSVVLEWETALEAGRARAVGCLEAINRQLLELARSGRETELVVCHDASEASGEEVAHALDEAAAGRGWPQAPIIAATPGHLDYYGKKNHGFGLTRGAIVVFLDSDLLPEDGWLASLVAAFDDYRRSVVVGRTHFDTATFYDRAVALFWIFETAEEAAIRPTARLVSNNIAFRRAVFTHFPFPQRPTFRGQCSELGSILAAHHIPLFEQPAARASHPPPRSAAAFLSRAFHAGRDQAFYDALAGRADMRTLLAQWRLDLRHVRERIASRRRAVGAGPADLLLAALLGLLYYTTKAAGYAAPASRRDQPLAPASPSGRL
jgi:hypothetical protein